MHHIFFIALTDWASLQLVSSFINCVLCERDLAKLGHVTVGMHEERGKHPERGKKMPNVKHNANYPRKETPKKSEKKVEMRSP